MSEIQTKMERYRVQFYTERHDGTHEYCVCDFAHEARTGRSPIVGLYFHLDYDEAVRIAREMNRKCEGA